MNKAEKILIREKFDNVIDKFNDAVHGKSLPLGDINLAAQKFRSMLKEL